MTVWEHLVANSTLAEADGDFWEHLTHPSGEGGGLIINSELVEVEVLLPVEVEVVDDMVFVEVEPIVLIDEIPDIILISEIKIGEIDVVC